MTRKVHYRFNPTDEVTVCGRTVDIWMEAADSTCEPKEVTCDVCLTALADLGIRSRRPPGVHPEILDSAAARCIRRMTRQLINDPEVTQITAERVLLHVLSATGFERTCKAYKKALENAHW